jgi:hypothetical protein
MALPLLLPTFWASRFFLVIRPDALHERRKRGVVPDERDPTCALSACALLLVTCRAVSAGAFLIDATTPINGGCGVAMADMVAMVFTT